TVAMFCDRVVWLKGGTIQAIGDTREVVSRYEDYLREKERIENSEITGLTNALERKMARVKEVRLVAAGQAVETSVEHSSTLEVIVDFEILDNVVVGVGFAVDRNDGLCCYGDSMQKQGIRQFQGPGDKSVSILFRNLQLLGGAYKFVIFLLDETGICLFDRKESQIVKVTTTHKEWGICYMEHEWKM
ncbi:MAG TPA: Wzt carbohydrate-binding domain-containing protein, partial [Thermodesulfovibrionales bacterium]|nr:Wzt carbohydrate-binding domain-containing protein [Thermodesulfovibrionales bacterium]